MKVKVVIHEAEEGGYWAEVPAIPGCATQGETFEELLANLYEAVEGCLSVDMANILLLANDRILEIAVSSQFPARHSAGHWNSGVGRCGG
jgi:predicted RNase H-like HicB family nuclease